MRLEVDSTKCTGCSICQLICVLHHFKENNPKKAAIRIVRKFPVPGSFEIRVCNQCGHCEDVCPEEAIYNEEEVYKIDREKCTNCGICIEECPTGTLFTHKEVDIPIKCDLCGECIEYCPSGALSWSKAEKEEAIK